MPLPGAKGACVTVGVPLRSSANALQGPPPLSWKTPPGAGGGRGCRGGWVGTVQGGAEEDCKVSELYTFLHAFTFTFTFATLDVYFSHGPASMGSKFTLELVLQPRCLVAACVPCAAAAPRPAGVGLPPFVFVCYEHPADAGCGPPHFSHSCDRWHPPGHPCLSLFHAKQICIPNLFLPPPLRALCPPSDAVVASACRWPLRREDRPLRLVSLPAPLLRLVSFSTPLRRLLPHLLLLLPQRSWFPYFGRPEYVIICCRPEQGVPWKAGAAEDPPPSGHRLLPHFYIRHIN